MVQHPAPQLDPANTAVQATLTILQGVIQRMAGNSASCKTWCITLVSAIIVVVAQQDRPKLALIGVVPTLLFFYLDANYLRLEKQFRNRYNDVVRKLHAGTLNSSDLFQVLPLGNTSTAFLAAMRSWSVWTFYVVILIAIGASWWVLQPASC